MSKTILILSANPTDTGRLRMDAELREIKNGLSRTRSRNKFELIAISATRPADIRRALLDTNPSIIHFMGHGEGELGISLKNEAGGLVAISEEALAALFKLFAYTVECVFLNACYSESQAKAIANHIDYVIGTSREIGDQAAIEFAVAFYDALGAGKNVEFSFFLGTGEYGCTALAIKGQ